MADCAESSSESTEEKVGISENLPSKNSTISENGMNKALLVDDYPNLSTAMSNLVSSLNNPNVEEILVALLYILVVESGFVPYPCDPISGDEKCQYNAQRLKTTFTAPKSWVNSEGFYQVYFNLAPYPEVKCKLVCVPLGSGLVANMYCSCSNLSFAIMITPSDHVTVYPEEVVFKRLKSLSLNFKSKVVVPIRTVMFNEIHQTTVGLFALPVEVLMKIISFLKVNDFLKWTSTCKYLFHTFSYDEHIWKQYCLLKFSQTSELHDTKESHREYYRRKMNFRNRVSCRVYHFSPLSLPEL